MLWTRRRSWQMGLGAVMALGLVIVVAAAHDEPDVTVVTMDPAVVRQGVRGGRIAPLTAQPGAEPTCTSPQPIGTWSCQNGVWVAGLAPASGSPLCAARSCARMDVSERDVDRTACVSADQSASGRFKWFDGFGWVDISVPIMAPCEGLTACRPRT